MTEELRFDFIKDEQLRANLERDHLEMKACAEIGAWKSVHVLAGSIVEAVLVEYVSNNGASKDDPLKMPLGALIKTCRDAGVLSERTTDLSSAVKSYRNMIHPGRSIRLGEHPDADGAVVAQSLVSMIVREVVAEQEQAYGLTAEQIVNKFESDPSAVGVAQHLLADAQEQEVRRLLLEILPERHFAELDDPDTDTEILESHASLYRAAFEQAPNNVKKAVMARYVRILREEPGPQVRVHEERFFNASDLEYVPSKDRDLVKAHLFARLREEPSVALVSVADGVGAYLSKKDVTPFVDCMVRAVVYHDSREAGLGRAARACLEAQADLTPRARDPEIVKRLGEWQKMLEERGRTQHAMTVEQIKAAFELFAASMPD